MEDLMPLSLMFGTKSAFKKTGGTR